MSGGGSAKPWSAETNDDATLANYPALVWLQHADDFDSKNPRVWPYRVGGLEAIFDQPLAKDDEGVYNSAGSTNATVRGTWPAIPSAYVVHVHTGKAGDTSHSLLSDTGDYLNGYCLQHNGSILLNNVAQYPGSGGGMIWPGFGRYLTDAIYEDWVSAGQPTDHFRAVSFRTEAQITSNTLDAVPSVVPSSLCPMQPTSGNVQIGYFNGVYQNQRFKLGALFAFRQPLTQPELNVAAEWMVHNPGKLYPGWRNRR